jgi:hypothetical protein
VDHKKLEVQMNCRQPAQSLSSNSPTAKNKRKKTISVRTLENAPKFIFGFSIWLIVDQDKEPSISSLQKTNLRLC